MKLSIIHSIIIKLFTAIAFFALAFGVPACKPCGDIEEYFDINQIEVFNYTKISLGYHRPLEEDSIEFEDYVIKCRYKVDYYSQIIPNYNLINTAYALSCVKPGERGSVEGIDTILVITQFDYDSTFLAGDTLSPIVTINDGWANNNFISLSEFITQNKENIRAAYGFDIQLTKKPKDLSTHYTFDVIVKLGNGEVHTSTTSGVYFK